MKRSLQCRVCAKRRAMFTWWDKRGRMHFARGHAHDLCRQCFESALRTANHQRRLRAAPRTPSVILSEVSSANAVEGSRTASPAGVMPVPDSLSAQRSITIPAGEGFAARV